MFFKNWRNFIFKNGDIEINSSQIFTLMLVDSVSDYAEYNRLLDIS